MTAMNSTAFNETVRTASAKICLVAALVMTAAPVQTALAAGNAARRAGLPYKPVAADVTVKIKEVKTEEDRITVTYDLYGSDETYDVGLILRRTSDPAFLVKPKNVTGAVGKGRFAGTGQRIIWSFKLDYPGGLPPADDYTFDITATRTGGDTPAPSASSGGGFPWVWVGVGAVAAGAGAVLLLSGKKDETVGGGSATQLPEPPGRP